MDEEIIKLIFVFEGNTGINTRLDIIIAQILRDIDNNEKFVHKLSNVMDMTYKKGEIVSLVNDDICENLLQLGLNEFESFITILLILKSNLYSVINDSKIITDNNTKYNVNQVKELSYLFYLSSNYDSTEKLINKFLDEKYDYTEKDVSDIIEILKNLNIDSKILNKVKRQLRYKFNDKNKDDIVKPVVLNIKQRQIGLTDKEYKKLINEIKKYFDIRKEKITRQLTSEEAIYCASLLMKIGAKEEVINSLFRQSEDIVNPISKYTYLYEKLNYYRDKIESSLEVLDDCFKESVICDEKDYDTYKSLIGEELEKINSILPNTYKYELERAKNYEKKEN